MFKRLFFISYAPKELHNLLSTFVVLLLLFSSAFLLADLDKFIYASNPKMDWEMFIGFGFAWAGIILSVLFSNFALRPIAEKHKNFWIVPYLVSTVVPLINGVYWFMIIWRF